MADFAKKLTVSFGAFSCTLSGFDDPFPVMSQVVDYFQKLSKSDPSFGAHPERPDTEALRILAEQTSGLSVGAQIKGDEVVLSSVPDEIEDEFDAPTTIDMPAEVTRVQVAAETPNIEDATTPELPADEIASAVSKAIEETKSNEISALIEETTLVELDEDIVEGPKENTEKPQSDVFGHLQIEDLDDEIFDNIDADVFYDSLEPETAKNDSPEPISEDVSAYVKEAVVFPDIENSERVKLATDEPNDDPVQDTATPEFDPLPIWAAELVSDEPIEDVAKIPFPPLEDEVSEAEAEDDILSYDDHVEAEQAALARILAATQRTGELSRSATNTAQTEDKVEEPETSLVDEANQPIISDTAAATVKSLVLGFGAAASLDATHEVKTGVLDKRTPPPTSKAFEAMGIYEEDDDNFGWSADSAGAEKPATGEDSTKGVPLLLTPMQEVSPVVEPNGEQVKTAPSSAINMNQADPRADLRRFADAAGAVSLTDLLEASAAYRTLVNGRPSFSRGEVLDLLDEFSDEEGFSQEARIKTFGSLLRGGRIHRVDNGEYEMSGDALSEYEMARKFG